MREFRHAHRRILSQLQINALNNTAIEMVARETAESLRSILYAYA